jgi:glycosyltransferase involved in cell wall biosynthesis
MNIWITVYGEPLPIDGKETRLRRIGNLAKQISTAGHEVHWFAVSFDHYKKTQRVDEDQTRLIAPNYYLHLAYVPGYKNNVSIQRLIHHSIAQKKIQKELNSNANPDVILVATQPVGLTKMVVDFGNKNGIPVVIDIRDLWPEIYVEVVPKLLKQLVKPYVALSRQHLAKAFKGAASIIGISDDFVKYGLNLAGRRSGVLDRVIPHGFPDFDYQVAEDNFLMHWGKYGLSPADFIVTFVGNFGRQFDFSEIVDASHRLADQKKIKFVLCGLGENLDNIRGYFGNNVILPGWIEQDQINSLLRYSSVGLAPYVDSINYRFSCSPNKFGEYASAGLPILVRIKGPMEDLLREYNCGFHYQDGQHLAGIILNYLSDPVLLNLHQANARNLFEVQFDGDVNTKKLFDHLCSVAEEFKFSQLS